MKKNKRTFIKSLLNRTKAYSLRDYVRKLRNDMCAYYTENDVLCALNRMQAKGQLWFKLVGKKVIGRVL
jgi:predicted DNA-binding protein